jgi:hypothetical protein
MKIYKFRDFRSRDYLADILKKERLFCAKYQDLNDPFEGMLNISRGMRRIKKLDEEKTLESSLEDRVFKPVFRDDWERIIDYNLLSVLDPNHDCTRVCSLSKSVTDVRLWSLYADSHRGCAFEIEIEPSPGLYPVKYIKSLSEIPQDKNIVLFHKSHHWSFEKEYRFVTSEDYISVKQRISSIQVGIRTSAHDIDFLLGAAPSYTNVFSSELDPHAIKIRRCKALR